MEGIPERACSFLHRALVWYKLSLLEHRMSGAKDKPVSPASSDDPKRPLGFAETCRARSLWSINESAECLVPPPHHCGYALSHGSHFYCHHPQRGEIVTRTLKLLRGIAP